MSHLVWRQLYTSLLLIFVCVKGHLKKNLIKNCLKSAATIFTKSNSIGPWPWILNDILCILLAQMTVKLEGIKVEGKKNSQA